MSAEHFGQLAWQFKRVSGLAAPRKETPNYPPQRQTLESHVRRTFLERRPSPCERNAAISWHFERDPIPYALETDWLAGAAGFEPLHLEIRSAELHRANGELGPLFSV